MKVQMKMSKNGCRMWVMKNAKPKFGIVYHERGGMLISYTSRLGNRYIYEFEEKTEEEMLDYIKCMTLTKNVDSDVYNHLTIDNVKDVKDYINDPMTATTFSRDEKGQSNSETITSELIYYWMIASNIPFECQKWHLNRLITLIRVCSIKNAPPKKRSKRDIMSRNAALNAARRKQMNTKG